MTVNLQRLKELAQGPFDGQVSQGLCLLGDHVFTVLPRGRGRFAYVLEDNWFSVQVSNACSLPLAHVQIRSEYLTAVGPEEAIRVLDRLIALLGEVRGEATIGRIDLYADFVCDLDITAEPAFAWVKRCRTRHVHEEGDRVTGISFGPGNELSARLYDKTFEITKSGKHYLKPLWAANGWKDGQTVWRLEFQARREAFAHSLKGPALEVLAFVGAWWRFLATEWLRLGIPSKSDETRSRWSTHPVWVALSEAFDSPPDAPSMCRVTKSRLPSDDAIFRQGISGLSSYMAREGISDLVQGLEGFLHGVNRYHSRFMGSEGFGGYIDRKRRLKARRYNTPLPTEDDASERGD